MCSGCWGLGYLTDVWRCISTCRQSRLRRVPWNAAGPSILDEPTTGLHSGDIQKLLIVLHRLVDKGNTMIMIEHQLDMIRNADYLIDLGPEAGEQGGYVVCTRSPEEVAQCKHSWTGKFLKG